MTQDIIKQVRDIIESGICEPSRLHHILDMLEKGKPLYNSDKIYLDKMNKKLEEKIISLKQENKKLNQLLMKQEYKLETKSSLNLDKVPEGSKSRSLIDDQVIDRLLDRQEKMQKKKKKHELKTLPSRKTTNSRLKKFKRIFSK